MSSNKNFIKNKNIVSSNSMPAVLYNFIKILNSIKEKYKIGYCIKYRHIEYDLLENSILNDTHQLVKTFKNQFDYNPPCLNLSAPVAIISTLLCDIQTYAKDLFIIDQHYIDQLENNKRYNVVYLNKNTYIIENINIPSNLFFYVINKNIIFNGQYNKITIENHKLTPIRIQSFKGLIKNGNLLSAGYDNCIIKNIFIDGKTNNVKLEHGAGWITHKYFGHGIVSNVNNCYSIGDMLEDKTGGICGSYNGYNGNLEILSCYSTGDILGNYSGGIYGSNLGTDVGTSTLIINNCYSLGKIGDKTSIQIGQGGIFGSYIFNSTNESLEINNCYSFGYIESNYAGGIIGEHIIEKGISANIINCYSTGIISGQNSGGIIGSNFGTSGEIIVTNCYSNGTESSVDELLSNIGPWDDKIWSSVKNSYPILNIFKISPWDTSVYNKYNDESKFI